jgi:acetyl-CoA carboxylase carboxyl transferase subunit alpha
MGTGNYLMTNKQFLDFEQPIAELDAKIDALRMLGNDSEINITEEISRLESKSVELTQSIFSNLEPWQVVQMARHPERPQTMDYISQIFTEFDECHGDRHYSASPAIIAGTARLEGKPVVVIGHQKGKKTKEKVYRNFGMARPEEYRRALRLMKMAEKYKMPVLTFIDTAGAYPGIGAEERNQSEAIARNLFEMSDLKVPIICTIVGEAGSGGALAIGVGDTLLMLQYGIYSVISPEGCASILWKDALRAPDAARAMQITAPEIKKMGLIDHVVPEPLGGAHRNVDLMCQTIKKSLVEELEKLQNMTAENLVSGRYKKYMAMGACD